MRVVRVVTLALALAGLGCGGSTLNLLQGQGFDQYGGYTGLKGTNTSGFFRAEKIDGRYWLVTPDNNVFWSTGICVLQYNDTWGGYCPTLGYYPYPYGTSSGLDDVVAWRSNGQSPNVNSSALALVNGHDYFISAKTVNGFGLTSDTSSSAPIRRVSAVYSIPSVRTLPVGSWVALEGLSVIARLTDRTYVEDPNRNSGMGVITNSALSVGDVASVFGQTQIVDRELVVNGGAAKVAEGTPLNPVAMASKALGGSGSGIQEPPVDNAAINRFASGLTNIGCLVTAFGRATYIDPWGTYLYLDDGSGIADGSGRIGVRVDCSGLALPVAHVLPGNRRDVGYRCWRPVCSQAQGEVFSRRGLGLTCSGCAQLRLRGRQSCELDLIRLC